MCIASAQHCRVEAGLFAEADTVPSVPYNNRGTKQLNKKTF